MNADLQGLWNYYFEKDRRKKCELLITDTGYRLTHDEAKKYVRYCIENGHTELYTCPKYDDYLKMKL